jgi:nucleotide-binding universal stress UspA family protein
MLCANARFWSTGCCALARSCGHWPRLGRCWGRRRTHLPVSSLSVPPSEQPTPTADALLRYESVSLLAQRAAAVLPGFAVNPDNCEAVARPCQRLDGIPLAIELAAVRLRALSVHQVLDRIEDRYGLRTGSPAAIPRQQTLWALIDWSFDLLTAQEPLVACSTPAGLLVVCSRGHGGFRTMVLGSTSRSSIEHAPGLVMVIPSGRHAPWTQRRLDRIR